MNYTVHNTEIIKIMINFFERFKFENNIKNLIHCTCTSCPIIKAIHLHKPFQIVGQDSTCTISNEILTVDTVNCS